MIDLIPLGDRAWLARFATESAAHRWAAAARSASIDHVTDIVVAYRSVSIHVDPDRADWDRLESELRNLAIGPVDTSDGRLIVVPVLYDGADLGESASLLGLTIDEVVALHAGTFYQVFAIGFQPGFPYAGYLPCPLEQLARRATPRVRVPAGSVAIAAGQTGIYPSECPGGWNLIGRTPLTIVDLSSGHFPIRAGDRLRFAPINREEFETRRGEILR